MLGDADGGRTLRGHVVSVSDGTGARFALLPPDNATGNFTKVVQRIPVRIALDDARDGAGREVDPHDVVEEDARRPEALSVRGDREAGGRRVELGGLAGREDLRGGAKVAWREVGRTGR